MSIKENDKHLVYHHNMFGPSCEIASLNNKEDFEIYCYREHKVCEPDCEGCQYLAHSEMGKGVCCIWEETYDSVMGEDHPVQHGEAYMEFQRVEQLKKSKEKANGADDEDDYIITECEVAVYLNKKFIMSLDAGMDAVIKFSLLADKGINGAEITERSFNCNRDVYISGKNLISFIEKEYPKHFNNAMTKIEKNNKIYMISCCDFS